MPDMPRVVGARSLAAGQFLAFKMLDWIDAHGTARTWETADRSDLFGAVLILPRLFPSRRLALIRQYRPPARGWVLEFPAGLMDAGESPEEAAARELREETGYRARRLTVHPPVYSAPGMSNEAVYMVEAEIDEDAPENRDLQTEFDPSETIESVLVAERDLPEFYRRETAKGTFFDGKLAGYILALSAKG